MQLLKLWEINNLFICHNLANSLTYLLRDKSVKYFPKIYFG